MQNNFSASSLKQRVMRRVYSIWLTRQVAPLVFIELPALALLGYLAAKFIFVERVMQNLAISAEGITDAIRFMLIAFLHTKTETQLVLGLSLAVGIFFMKDFTKSIRGLSLILR